jgi:hypothetical protein
MIESALFYFHSPLFDLSKINDEVKNRHALNIWSPSIFLNSINNKQLCEPTNDF